MNVYESKVGVFILVYTLSFVFGYTYKLVLKKFSSKNINRRSLKNINAQDRLIRLFLGIILLLLGLFNWSPIILFFSGFCFYEALVSWCGFNALLNKNSCAVN